MTCMEWNDSMQSITGRHVKNESFAELSESLSSLACGKSKHFDWQQTYFSRYFQSLHNKREIFEQDSMLYGLYAEFVIYNPK